MNGPPNFDPLAGLYRWMEWFSFGPLLSLTRRTFLAEASSARRALVLGDGDGRFTCCLLRANSSVHVDAVDGSAAMLRQLLRRAGAQAGRVTAHLADVRTWQPPASLVEPPYDLVCAHFLLDCLTGSEVDSVVRTVQRASCGSCLWVVSEFAVPQGLFGDLIARPLVRFLYWIFGFLTGLEVRSLPDYGSVLESAGFARIRRRARLRGLLVAEVWRCDAPCGEGDGASGTS